MTRARAAPLIRAGRGRRSTRWLPLLLGQLGQLAWTSLAVASPLFELVGGVQGHGGLNARATEAGAASAYFNPAFLTLTPPSLEAGVFVLEDRISIRLDERPGSGADIPVGFQNAADATGASFPSYALPTSWLEAGNLELPSRPRQQAGSSDNVRGYLVLGGVLQWFEGRLALGVYTLIPSGQYTGASAFFVDEREQYFTNSLHAELYSDRLTATSLAFGLGVRLGERLSLGLAATLALAAQATTPTFLNDISRFQDLRIGAEVGVDVKLAPHAGLVYQPSDRLQLAATLHTPQKFEVVTDFTFLVANGIYQRAQIEFIHHYVPLQVALGANYEAHRAADDSLLLVASLLYAHWSQYQDRHAERPLEPYAWYDTVAPSMGVRWRREQLQLSLDTVCQPTPVPAQTGRTNYVDNARIGMAAGAELAWPLARGELALGVRAEVHGLLARTTRKLRRTTALGNVNGSADFVLDEVPDDAQVGAVPLAGREGLQSNNPGWPGFSSSGWLLGASASVSYRY